MIHCSKKEMSAKTASSGLGNTTYFLFSFAYVTPHHRFFSTLQGPHFQKQNAPQQTLFGGLL